MPAAVTVCGLGLGRDMGARLSAMAAMNRLLQMLRRTDAGGRYDTDEQRALARPYKVACAWLQ
jgi:hypothetical protein